MKFITSALVVATTLFTAAAARADGLYVGGNVGVSRYHGEETGGLSIDRTHSDYKLYGGYSLTPNFSLEAGYADLGRFNGDGGKTRADAFFLDGVGTLPLGNQFSALGRLGVVDGRVHRDVTGIDSATAHGIGVKLGAGLQYDLQKNVSLRGEWERYRLNGPDDHPQTDVFSVGVNYRF